MALSDQWSQLQLRQASQRELMDPNARWWAAAELDSYVESWQESLQHNHEFYWGTLTVTTTLSTLTIASLATDILRLDAMYWNNRRLFPRSEEDMNGLDPLWRDTVSATPGVVIPIDSNRVQLFPPPNTSGTLYFEYPRLTTFTSTADTMVIPAWTKYTCAPYICYRAYSRPGPNCNPTKALRYRAQWEKSKAKITDLWSSYLPQRAPILRPGGHYEYDQLNIWDVRGNRTTGTAVPAITSYLHNDEVPTGTVNGTNTTFTLSFAPNPVASLKLYVDGIKYTVTTHYTLSSTTITFVSAFKPITGQTLFATYRYVS